MHQLDGSINRSGVKYCGYFTVGFIDCFSLMKWYDGRGARSLARKESKDAAYWYRLYEGGGATNLVPLLLSSLYFTILNLGLLDFRTICPSKNYYPRFENLRIASHVRHIEIVNN